MSTLATLLLGWAGFCLGVVFGAWWASLRRIVP